MANIASHQGLPAEANVHATDVASLQTAEDIYNNVTTGNLDTIDSWSAKMVDGSLVTSFADDLVNVVETEKLEFINAAENSSVLFASTSVRDTVGDIKAETLVQNVDRNSVVATEASCKMQ